MAGFWKRLVKGTRRFLHRPDWITVAGADFAKHIMDRLVTDRFHAKQGRSTGRLILQENGQTLAVYLKRHYQLPWWQRVVATVWPAAARSPAITEWQHLEWAKTHGIPVPRPVAAGEWIGPWLRLQSFLAIEELPGMIPLHEAVPLAREHLSPQELRDWKRAVTQELARLSRLLHQVNRYHKDFYLCHFFLSEEEVRQCDHLEGRIYLIDLHRLAHHAWLSRRWQVKDLAQLLYSSGISGVDDRDRLRFMKRYLNVRKLHPASRRLIRRIVRKAGLYKRHNASNTVESRPAIHVAALNN